MVALPEAAPAKPLPPVPITAPAVIVRRLVFGLIGLAILVWAYQGADMRPYDLYLYRSNMLKYTQGFLTPDLLNWRHYLVEMGVTIQIAIWGTLLAIVAAIPCALLSSSNIVPVWVYQPVRRVMDTARAINEMIFAMLFIAAVGLGPFAGVLALFVHTMGTLAKLFSEAVEAIDPRPVEGIRATGAHGLEEIVYGVIPQVLPLWISYALYRFESNVRSASVVGMVGAGGIGMLLWEAIRSFEYGQTAALLLIIVVVVSLLDLVSALIRRQWI
jgi:phosphonate transport system permease protein